MYIILAILGLLAVGWVLLMRFKRPQIGRLHIWSGGVKTGKTANAVRSSIRLHRKAVRAWKKSQKRDPSDAPCPRLYSNMPIKGYRYYPLTEKIVKLEEKVPFGSVIYINEASLFSGCMDIKSDDLNDRLTHFYKLCAHITGGYVILDSQNVMDVHFTAKRSLSTYWHIIRSVTIPHVGILSIIESREVVDSEIKSPQENADRRSAVRSFVEWLLPSRIFVRFCPATIFRRYDQYAYRKIVEDKPLTPEDSILTDDGKTAVTVRLRDLGRGVRK